MFEGMTREEARRRLEAMRRQVQEPSAVRAAEEEFQRRFGREPQGEALPARVQQPGQGVSTSEAWGNLQAQWRDAFGPGFTASPMELTPRALGRQFDVRGLLGDVGDFLQDVPLGGMFTTPGAIQEMFPHSRGIAEAFTPPLLAGRIHERATREREPLTQQVPAEDDALEWMRAWGQMQQQARPDPTALLGGLGGLGLGGGQRIDLGQMGELPRPPQQHIPPATDFGHVREMMERAGPEEFERDQQAVLWNMLAGIAGGGLGADLSQGLGPALLQAGLGGLAGLAGGELGERGRERELRQEQREHAAATARMEIGLTQAEAEERRWRYDTQYQNDVANYARELQEYERRQPQILGISQGQVFLQRVGPDGRQQLEIIGPSPMEQTLALHRARSLAGEVEGRSIPLGPKEWKVREDDPRGIFRWMAADVYETGAVGHLFAHLGDEGTASALSELQSQAAAMTQQQGILQSANDWPQRVLTNYLNLLSLMIEEDKQVRRNAARYSPAGARILSETGGF